MASRSSWRGVQERSARSRAASATRWGGSPARRGAAFTGSGRPVAVTETTEVEIRRYDEVDAAFTFEEGEGDRSLAYWREAHKRYFGRTLPAIGREFSEDMPLVCVRFQVAYR